MRERRANVGDYVGPGLAGGGDVRDRCDGNPRAADRRRPRLDAHARRLHRDGANPGPAAHCQQRDGGRLRTWEGRLVRTEASVDARTRLVYGVVEVRDPFSARHAAPLAPGMFVTARLEGSSRETLVAAPRSALKRNEFVYVVRRDNTIDVRQVRAAQTTADEVLFREGVADGERVVVSVLTSPRQGMAVTPIRPAAGEAAAQQPNAALADDRRADRGRLGIHGRELQAPRAAQAPAVKEERHMLKGLVAWWGRNPVAGNLLMIVCVVAGIFSFNQMEKEFWPPGRDDGVFINAFWPGASPEDMEQQVIVRIEEATADLDNVDWVRSRSGEGYGWVRIAADPGADVDAMTEEVRSRVDSISGLPQGMEPIQVSAAGRAQLVDHHRRARRRRRAHAARHRRTAARPHLAAARRRQHRSSWARARRKSRSRCPRRRCRRTASRSTKWRARCGPIRSTSARARCAPPTATSSCRRAISPTRELDFENIIIRQTADGGVVRVGDVATVIDGFQDTNLYSRMNGEPSTLVSLQTADQFNIWDTDEGGAGGARRTFRAELPAGVQHHHDLQRDRGLQLAGRHPAAERAAGLLPDLRAAAADAAPESGVLVDARAS